MTPSEAIRILRIVICSGATIFLLAADRAPTTAPSSSAWRTKQIASSHAINLANPKCEPGMRADVVAGALQLSLDGVPYSAAELVGRDDYHPHDAVAIDVAAIKNGSLTLQAVCDDGNGGAARYVDLLENIEAPGRYEVPLWIYRTPLNGAKRVAMKIWIAGDHPTATVSAVTYGIAGK
jgi:hypothetical protein